MGRKRKSNKHLPERMYCKSGTYYFLDIEGKYFGLGRDYVQAMTTYAKIRGPIDHISTVTNLVDRYIQEVSPTKAASTYKEELRLSKFIKKAFGKYSPDRIKPIGIYAYRDARGKVGQVQTNRELALLSSIFSKAVEWGVVESNPCKQVKRFTEKPRDRYITDQEYIAFTGFAPPLIAAYCDFKLLTGMRKKDILALTKGQLKDDGIHIQTSKTKRKLVIEWSESLRTAVTAIKALERPVRSFYLFCNRSGQAYTTDGFSSIWQRTMRRALEQGVIGERFTDHDIRAKTGSDITDLEHARRLLTHSNTMTTERHYRRKTPTAKPLR